MTKPELLGTKATHDQLKRLLRAAGTARLAVAFWGNGAVRSLGLRGRKGQTQVLCDLFSGCCNPDEIKRLLRAHVEVRYVSGLHAKLYSTPGGVVVGSSNASANGLGFEGHELTGNVELNVLIKDRPLRTKAEAWFDQLWEEGGYVDDEVAESARTVWSGRRAFTLLKALATDAESFRTKPIKILVYRLTDFDDDTDRWLREEGPTSFSKQELRRMGETNLYDFWCDFSDWPVQPGTVYLDFPWARENALPDFVGVWRVRPADRWGQTDKGTRIITSDRLGSVDGLQFPKSEQDRFRRVLKSHLQANHLWGQDTKENHYNNLDISLYDFWEEHRSELKAT